MEVLYWSGQSLELLQTLHTGLSLQSVVSATQEGFPFYTSGAIQSGGGTGYKIPHLKRGGSHGKDNGNTEYRTVYEPVPR